MNYFTVIPEGQAILNTKGVYRQVMIYRRLDSICEYDGRIYAKYGAGFIKLAQGGTTSHPNVRWLGIDPGEGRYLEAKGGVWFVAPATTASANNLNS